MVAFQRRSVSSARQLDDAGAAEVHLQLAVLDEDPRPDDLAGLGDALERAAAEAEVHRRLPLAGGAAPAADEVGRRGRAADQEHPDVVLDRARAVPVAPADVVQRVFDRLAHRLVDAVGHQAVEAGALVHLVEVRQRLARRRARACRRGCVTGGRSALLSVPSTRSLAGSRSFRPCWYWMPIVCAAEIVGDPHGGDVHLALREDLVVGQVGLRRSGR